MKLEVLALIQSFLGQSISDEDSHKHWDVSTSEEVNILSLGNADVKKSSSVIKQSTGTNTTRLTLESLNGIRQVKDAVTAEDGKIHIVEFHKKLMSCTRRINERDRQILDEIKER